MDIYEFNFSIRTMNILRLCLVETVEDLQQISACELMNFKHCGKKTLEEIREKLAKYQYPSHPLNKKRPTSAASQLTT